MSAARQRDRAAMVHCITILSRIATDPIALVIAQVTTLVLTRFMSMSDQMIRGLTYKEDPEAENAVSKNLEDGDAWELICLRWFLHYTKETYVTFDLQTVLQLTHDEFGEFLMEHALDILPGMSKKDFKAAIFPAAAAAPPPPTNVAGSASTGTVDYSKQVKLYTIKMQQWDGDPITWFPTRLAWEQTFAMESMDDILEVSYTPPDAAASEADRRAYSYKTKYVCHRLTEAVTSGQAKIIVVELFSNKNGREIWLALKKYYEAPSIIEKLNTSYTAQISTLRYHDYTGTPKQFLIHFATKLNLLATLSQYAPTVKPLSDAQKITWLETAIDSDDSKGDVFRTHLNTISTMKSLGTHTQLNYTKFFESLMDTVTRHAKSSLRNVMALQGAEPDDGDERSDGQHGTDDEQNDESQFYYDDDNEQNDESQFYYDDDDEQYENDTGNEDWRTDLTASLPSHIWNSLSEDEKEERKAAHRAAKEANEEQNTTAAADTQLQLNAAAIRILNALATAEEARGSTTTLPQPQVAPQLPTETASQAPSLATPSIRDIMAALRQPAGASTGTATPSSRIGTLKTVRMNTSIGVANPNFSLVDSGADMSLAGEAMILFKQPKKPTYVNVLDVSDTVNSAMGQMLVATHCTKITTSCGISVLGIFPNSLGYYKGKSILCQQQAAAHGLHVDPIARQFDGGQKIITKEKYVAKLVMENGLAYLPITKPNEEDIATLPHVAFGSETWDPTTINDYDDEWLTSPDAEDLHGNIAHLQDPSASGEDMLDMIDKIRNNKNKNFIEEQILHLLAERSENMQTVEHNITFNLEKIKLPKVDHQWDNAINKDMNLMDEFNSLQSLGKNALTTKDFQKIESCLIYNEKQDAQRKARQVYGEIQGAQLKIFIPPEEENFIDEESGKLDVYQIHLNGDGEPRHNLGGDLHCTTKPTKQETTLTWKSSTAIALFLFLVITQIISPSTKGSVSFHWYK